MATQASDAGTVLDPSAGADHRRMTRDVVIQIGARIFNLALGIVVTSLVVRTLGEAGFGEWSTLLVAIQLTAYFTSFGVESVAVRQVAIEPQREADWVGALLMVRMILSLPAGITGLIVVLVAQNSTSMLVAGLILLAQLPFNTVSSLRVVYQSRVRNDLPMYFLTLNSVLWGAAVVVIYFAGGGLVALAIAMTATGLVTVVWQAVIALRFVKPHLPPPRDAMIELTRIGIPVGTAGLLIIIYARIDQLIVYGIAGASDAGLYGAVYRIIEQAHFIPISLMTTAAPILAASYMKNREHMLGLSRLIAELLTVASLGGLAVAIVVAEPLTVFLFGESFKDAAPALPVLSGAFVFICYGYLNSNLLLVIGLQKRLIITGLLALVVNIGGNLIFVPIYGFMAAAWLTLITEFVVVLAATYFVRHALQLGWPALGRVPRIVVAAAVLGLGLAGFNTLGVPLAGLLVIALVAYPTLLFILRAVDLREVRALLRGGATLPAAGA
jgi:O-antigen/teichoic acid export membrane protein